MDGTGTGPERSDSDSQAPSPAGGQAEAGRFRRALEIAGQGAVHLNRRPAGRPIRSSVVCELVCQRL